MKKRILTIIITLAMAMGMISAATTTVFAEASKSGTWGEYEEIGGEYKYTYANFLPFVDSDQGTMDNPYEIHYPEQLAGLAAMVNAYNKGSNVTLTDLDGNKVTATNFFKNGESQYIKLMKNLDLIGPGWVPIGTDLYNEFKGIFDGNGYTISGMAIGTANAANPECQYAGLFGYMTAGSIKNLSVSGLVNVSNSNKAYAGGIVGYAEAEANANAITIENCSSTVSVTASSTGTAYAGGLMGNASGVKVTNCYNTGTVAATTYAGGLVGNASSGVTITNCYNTGTVAATTYAGGLVGNASSGVTITNCYNTGTVSATTNAGGLLGIASNTTITNCYSACSVSGTNAGGFIGNAGNTITIENCYRIVGINAIGTGSDSNGSTQELSQGQMQGSAGATDSSWENISIIAKYGSLVDALNQYVVNNSAETLRPWHIHNGEYPTLGVGETITPNTDGQTHTVTCGCNISTTEEHSGGTATCTEQANCQHCGASYGEVGGHSPDAAGYTDNADGTHSFECSVCDNTVIEDHSTTADGDKPANCGSKAYCSKCDSEYGDVDKSNHDETMKYENGFCPNCDAYEPATDSNSDGYYEIASAGQLYWFAKQVNSGNNVNAVLTTDIVINSNCFASVKNDLSLVFIDANDPGETYAIGTGIGGTTAGAFYVKTGDGYVEVGDNAYYLNEVNELIAKIRPWTPIGNATYGFSGTFDGNGKTISGLYININDSSATSIGLFGYISDGTVKDLTLSNSFFNGYQDVGGVVGSLNNGTIKNCTSYATVCGALEIGGIAGDCSSGANNISGCYNRGIVSAKDHVGGIIGGCENSSVYGCYNYGNVIGTNNCVGGIVGLCNYSLVSGCTNNGNVSGGGYVGGVVGYNNGSTVKDCYSDNCTVSGTRNVGGIVGSDLNVTVNRCNNTSTVSGTYQVGGVVGDSQGSSVSDCYNTGNISGTKNVGGVVGYAYDSNCNVSNCYNIGKVSGETNVGGIVGSDSATVSNCYYLADSETDSIDGTTFKTAAQFASGEVAYLLNGDQTTIVWYQTCGTGLPAFSGNTVYKATKGCTGAYVNDQNAEPEHTFTADSNGFCAACGSAYQPAVLNGNIYEISSAGQLYWFAQQVNGGNTYINGKLTANIVVNEGTMTSESTTARVWTPIGNETNKYGGNFYGNGKTVSGLYFNNSKVDYVGLFGYANGWIENVGVINSFIKGGDYVGGVVGCNNSNVLKCYNASTVSGNNYVGGIVGSNNYTVRNCFNTGTVSGNNFVGGVVGDNNLHNTVTNCYNTGDVSGTDRVGGVIGINSMGTVTNCYYLNTAAFGGIDGEDATDQAEAKTADQFTSGEVAYLLNGDQSGIVWYQTCGEGLPAYSGIRVYRNQLGGCSEVSYKYEYSNEQKTPVTTHDTTKYTYANASIVNSITATCGDCQTAWTVTLTAPENAVYNGSFIPATVIGEIPGVKVTVSYNKDPINAGAYTASVTLGDVEASVEYNIAQKVLVPTITGRVTKVYDGTNAVPAGLNIVLEGIVGADNVTASAIYTFDRPDAGTKKVNAECILLSGEKLGNYTLSSSTASADVGEITKAPSYLETAPVGVAGLIYNQQAYPLVIPGTAQSGTVVYSLDGMNWSNRVPTAVNAGSYTVFYKIVGDQNHLDSSVAIIPAMIAQREIGIVWGKTDFVFNEQRQAPTATGAGVLPGDICIIEVQGWGIYGGTYTATANSVSNPNYKLPANNTCQFTITTDYDKEADKVYGEVGDFINDQFNELGVPNILDILKNLFESLFKILKMIFN